MELQAFPDEDPEINLTSLIDVVFLLLIFFMVSTTFERQALLRIQLPEAATGQVESVSDRIELVISEAGDFYVDERLVADDRKTTLMLALKQAFEARPDALLVIRADGGAPHRLVVRAMDAAAAQGITRLRIATVEPTGPES